MLIEHVEQPPLRRILPEAKPRNPKLADVLRVFRKWEGRGIGMATLVNLCLANRIDLPYYVLGTEEVKLHLCSGKLLDDRMERLFKGFGSYLEKKLHGAPLTGIVLEGELTVDYGPHGKRTYRQGDAIAEAIKKARNQGTPFRLSNTVTYAPTVINAT